MRLDAILVSIEMAFVRFRRSWMRCARDAVGCEDKSRKRIENEYSRGRC